MYENMTVNKARVTKAPFVEFFISEISAFSEIRIASFESHSDLTGIIAASTPVKYERYIQ